MCALHLCICQYQYNSGMSFVDESSQKCQQFRKEIILVMKASDEDIWHFYRKAVARGREWWAASVCGVCSAGSQTWAGPCRGQSEVDNVTEQTRLRPGQATQHVWQVILRLVTTHHVSRVIVMDNTITHMQGYQQQVARELLKRLKGVRYSLEEST